ncbi:putative serine/threonine-protein kinase drkA [Phytophthora citrophthora]|uniref:Serine/threonine-protein kinase drkA n=1 Tax=Phytophthora citrophthora TaxID=4793 RepID=A0AAD9GXQ4_9STRA|nr:putative serine/threonine-protein kinase drkA [Phytophthora citrophthora]
MSMMESSSCTSVDCTVTYIGSDYYYYTTACPSNAKSYAADTYGSTKYLLIDVYSDTSCTTYTGTVAIIASGKCEVIGTTGQGVITTVYSNGSAQFENFVDSSCTVSTSTSYLISADLLSSHSCFQGFKLYSNSDGSTTDGTGETDAADEANSGTSGGTGSGSGSGGSSGTSIGVIIGIAAGVVLLLLIIGILWWRCRRNKNKQEQPHVQSPGAFQRAVASPDQFYRAQVTPQKSGTASTTLASSDGVPSKLWDDEAIIAARIPREKVVAERLINRGGFGEVYAGTYNGQQVAIKMLLPERKKSLTQVNAFLSEVKLMSTLDHAHIVEFIGVAWDSLTDLCVVTEYMVIDLKALLSKFEEQQMPVGFDHDKVKVALHVAHALTYLHSCAPPVIHRDLKSSNILLSETMDAKITDFGISRERIDATMTAGVGTSLWMAPEVMLGERYDDKADMFSFGIVMSELDQHTLPYSHAKNNSHSGQRLTDTAILQMVAAGKLRVQFSQAAPESLVQLGLACVSTDPKLRPTAAEALYRLQTILAREM